MVASGGKDWNRRLSAAIRVLRQGKLVNLSPLLPLLLNLRGEPYTLRNHFPFEPFFSTALPRNLLLKTARQVSKSTSLASKGTVQANCISHFSRLYITPLYEMIRRFSTNYVRPFIDTSPVRNLWTDTSTTGNVLQRSFTNQSQMFFTFAFLDCERVRGLATDACSYDEVQDLDRDFIPIIRETMSASKWSLQEFAGTPKTLDNTIEQLWLDSSQAEWVIPCRACNYRNIPSLVHDLDKMIGPRQVTREISEKYPGVVCAKCQRPIYPRQGRWVHAFEELKHEFSGYHVPQIIMPMHYADGEKWKILLGKRQGVGHTAPHVFYNEVCGESFDTGARLITQSDLKRAATLHENIYEQAVKRVGDYVHRVLAVDWGGGGEKEVSFTTAAVLGMLPDGRIHAIYGWRSLTPHLHNEEARYLLHLTQAFRCSHIAHDYGGAGAIRETLWVNAGWPLARIIPIAYVRAAIGPLMRWIPENENTGQRSHYRVDKARSLTMVCDLIRMCYIRFFKYDYHGIGEPGLLHDFLALVEDMIDSRRGSNIYTVIRNAQVGPDDFAQAVNIGVCTLFYKWGKFPDTAKLAQLQANQQALSDLATLEQQEWEDLS